MDRWVTAPTRVTITYLGYREKSDALFIINTGFEQVMKLTIFTDFERTQLSWHVFESLFYFSLQSASQLIVCYKAVFSIVTQRSCPLVVSGEERCVTTLKTAVAD